MGYLNSYYDIEKKPINSYPEQLVKYLVRKFKIGNKTLLEAGVGRSEHLKIFEEIGVKTFGFDSDTSALNFNKNIKIFDSETEIWPYSENSFDVIYSKSFIEHLKEPNLFFKNAFKILRPGGLLITLTPDWESNYKKFYDDFTHRSPFTRISLQKIMEYNNFENSTVIKFRQLPIVWKYPKLNLICDLIAPFVPVRTEQKFLRWSRELMLIGSGIKPE